MYYDEVVHGKSEVVLFSSLCFRLFHLFDHSFTIHLERVEDVINLDDFKTKLTCLIATT